MRSCILGFLSAFIFVDLLPFVWKSCIHICLYSYASFPFYCGHTHVHVVMHSYIFPLLFTALFKLGLLFNFALKRNCCVVESVFIAVVVIKMTLIMMIAIEWGWRCDAFVCVVTDFPSSVQRFVFILWRNVMIVMRIWLSSERLCKSSVFVSLVILLFFLWKPCPQLLFCVLRLFW